jgi:hypothetical protein
MKKKSVVQDWVSELPLMQQTVLLSAIRNTDMKYDRNMITKHLMKWYRRCVLLSAFEGKVISDPFESGGGSFTGGLNRKQLDLSLHILEQSFPSACVKFYDGKKGGILSPETQQMKHGLLMEFFDAFIEEIEFLPMHFFTHFLDAIKILGYKHPNEEIRRQWDILHTKIAVFTNFVKESPHSLDHRFNDSEDDWYERKKNFRNMGR